MKIFGLYVMSAFFLFTGLTHLFKPDDFIKIIPPFLPWPYALALLSGVAEIILAVGLLPLKTRRTAAWGVIALLIAVFPANIYMYMIRETSFPNIPAWALLLRLPLQIALIAWAMRKTALGLAIHAAGSAPAAADKSGLSVNAIRYGAVLFRKDRAQIEHDAAFIHPGDDRRLESA